MQVRCRRFKTFTDCTCTAVQWGEALQRWLAVQPAAIRIIFNGRDADDFKVRFQGFARVLPDAVQCKRITACGVCDVNFACGRPKRCAGRNAISEPQRPEVVIFELKIVNGHHSLCLYCAGQQLPVCHRVVRFAGQDQGRASTGGEPVLPSKLLSLRCRCHAALHISQWQLVIAPELSGLQLVCRRRTKLWCWTSRTTSRMGW